MVGRIAAGRQVDGAVSRLRFLGEEGYAAKRIGRLIDTPDVRERRDLTRALSELETPRAARFLEQLASDDDGAVRMEAVRGLGRIHSRAVGAVRPLLADPSAGVRREAAITLGGMHLARLGRILLTAARQESEPEVRAAMLIAVGQSGNRRGAEGLRRFLRSTSESTRLAAAKGLCLLGDRAGFSFARKLLASKDPLDRRSGVQLFDGASARVARSVLAPVLSDPDGAVSSLAARILYEGGDRRMIRWLVLAEDRAEGEAKLPFGEVLDELEITEGQREAILRRAHKKPAH